MIKTIVKLQTIVIETSQFNEDFIKRYNKDSNIGYFLTVDTQYPEELHELDNDLPFLPERVNIEKVEKLVAKLLDIKVD